MRIGTIEITQGAVVYIVLMVVVVFVGMAIVLKTNPLDFLRQRELSRLFEPGKFYMCGGSPTECKPPEIFAECQTTQSGQGTYNIIVRKASFVLEDPAKKEGDIVYFLLFVEVGNKVFAGSTEDASIEFSCRKESDGRFNCGEPRNIVFVVTTDQPARKEIFHLTAWRNTRGVYSILDDPDPTFSKLLENNFEAYLGAVDVGGSVTLDYLCAKSACKATTDPAVCGATQGCYFRPGFFGGTIGSSCEACKQNVQSCQTFLSREECGVCPQLSQLTCLWDNECRPAGQ